MKKDFRNNKGQKLLKIAKKIIPGGNQLLSKRSEIFLPDLWPNYYTKAKGCELWDLEKNRFYDFAGMGVTTCILGYADKDVNSAVNKAVKNSTMTTLNTYEEVELAEKLLDLHKWAEQVRFARTGGEACSIAIRLARAATGKDKILFCGYHGWHDWYLSANLKQKNLDDQLLPGLESKGVPSNLRDSVYPFGVNDYESFESALKKFDNKIGAVIMEPVRSAKTDLDFLKKVRKKTKQIGAVFIFDEITSGFRETIGGYHLKYKINPDVAILSKAMSNGYPSSAIIGIKSVMDQAQDTFVSSCMWTERIGFAAALATINKIEKKQVIKKLVSTGKKIKNGWMKAAKDTNLKISTAGIHPIPELKFNYTNFNEISTYFIQEMLDRGFLANTRLGTTFAYKDKIIDLYIENVHEVFRDIEKYLSKNSKLPLKGPIRHTTFKRLI